MDLTKPFPDIDSFKEQVRIWTVKRSAERRKINWQFTTADMRIRTTGLAGGLLTPYKGSLPALESKDSSKGLPAATSFCTKS